MVFPKWWKLFGDFVIGGLLDQNQQDDSKQAKMGACDWWNTDLVPVRGGALMQEPEELNSFLTLSRFDTQPSHTAVMSL